MILGRKIHEQNELFTVEIIFKKDQTNSGAKKSMDKMKNTTQSICSRVEHMENRINDLRV